MEKVCGVPVNARTGSPFSAVKERAEAALNNNDDRVSHCEAVLD